MEISNLDIAVVLPCYNEEHTIADTIAGFKKYLPAARIVVCDNNSTDNTAQKAQDAGARVIHQSYKGKGNAVRRLFTEVEADVYVMADGDTTYDAASAPKMIKLLTSKHLDMVVGKRAGSQADQYRIGHKFANALFSKLFAFLFSTRVDDLMSGYRVMSRRFVKTFPCASRGFEIETELNAHSALYNLPIYEIETPYFSRPEGSESKLDKFSDGFRILWFFILFLRDYAPFRVFGGLGVILIWAAVLFATPIIIEYYITGLVPRMPTWFGSLTLFIIGVLLMIAGFAMQALAAARYQAFMHSYHTQSIRPVEYR